MPQLSRVLILAADPELRRFLAAALAGRYAISVACDGLEAALALTRASYALLILEPNLAGTDGSLFLRALRRQPPYARLRVVLLLDPLFFPRQWRGLGVRSFLVKPFTLQQFRTAVAAAVQGAAASAPRAAPASAPRPLQHLDPC